MENLQRISQGEGANLQLLKLRHLKNSRHTQWEASDTSNHSKPTVFGGIDI